MKTMGLMLMGLMILIGGCDNIAPELLPALPGDDAGAPAFVPDRPYVRAYLVSPKPRVTLGREKQLEAKTALIRTLLLEVQELYASEMDRHGHGRMTFPIALDAAGRVHVTHITLSEEAHVYKGSSREVHSAVIEVVGEPPPAERKKEIELYITYNFSVGCGTAGGGFAWVSASCLDKETIAHELGHVFGLEHDWRDGELVMSYGTTRAPNGTRTPVADPMTKLSRGEAAWVSYHPAFSGHVPPRKSNGHSTYICSLTDVEWGMAPVEGNTEGLHQFQFVFNVFFYNTDPIRGLIPAPAYTWTGFAMARLLERTASNVKYFHSGHVIRYLDKDVLQSTLHKDGTGAATGEVIINQRGDYLEYDLRFKGHLSADAEEIALEFIMPDGNSPNEIGAHIHGLPVF